ncbi:MAG: cell division topological specificity factor MinE [Burkholderiaceae bacterium]|nr:cell division topological specificity factor MinE [Burkholderiaceae bacterium]
MSLFDLIFKRKLATASIAKERLQILIAHEHGSRSAPDYLQDLHRDLITVISKYVSVSPEDIKISRDRQGDIDILDVNIAITNPAQSKGT